MPYKNQNSDAAKASMARRNKTYYEKNKDKIIAYKKVKQSDYRKKWYAENRDRLLKQNNMSRRLRMFGITKHEYYEMYNKQNGQCAICGKHSDDLDRELCVDHCHITGKIRGLLCSDCNIGIGRLKDNLNRLEKAVDYLRLHS